MAINTITSWEYNNSVFPNSSTQLYQVIDMAEPNIFTYQGGWIAASAGRMADAPASHSAFATFDPASGILQSGYGPYDLLVYGATPSGISAAVAASRQGMKVAIFEPTGWIGGMMTGGITHTDVSETVQKGVVVNWPDQLFRRIAEDGYGILQNNYWLISSPALKGGDSC